MHVGAVWKQRTPARAALRAWKHGALAAESPMGLRNIHMRLYVEYDLGLEVNADC